MRIGSGFDVHAFGPGDSIVLGGVRIAHSRGIVAHSDGDVVLHALCDAMLGAAGLGDIGMHFPDTDPMWKGAESRRFVEAVIDMLKARKLKVGMEPSADIGPMTMPAQITIIRRHIDDAIAHGGRAVVGGADAVRPPFVHPTVLVDVPEDVRQELEIRLVETTRDVLDAALERAAA